MHFAPSLRVFLCCALVALAPGVARAAGLQVEHAWVRLPLPGADMATAYMTLRNDGDADIVVDSVMSEAAEHAAVHRTVEQGGMLRMESLSALVVPGHGVVNMVPGHMHVMLEGLKRRLKSGDRVRLVLHTASGETLTVEAPVRASTQAAEPGRTEFEQGMRRLKAHDTATAARLFERAAAQGNRRARYQLGLLYARGDGVEKDLNKARELFRQAAMQGHPKAQFYLGQMYAFGDGGVRDPVRATMWFWLAASLGDRYARDSLRVMTGKIAPEELARAKRQAKAMWRQIPHDMKIKRRMAMH